MLAMQPGHAVPGLSAFNGVRPVLRRLMPAFAALVVAVLCLAVSGAALAQSRAQVYTQDGVAVDETAGNANAAREKALAVGQRKALDMLLRGMTDPRDHGRLPQPSDDQLLRLVRSIDVANEAVAPQRYRATLTVRFDAEGVRGLLRNAGIAFAAADQGLSLVVPVIRTDGSIYWDDGWWRAAWEQAVGRGGLIPMLVPLGDFADRQALPADGASLADDVAKGELAKRYDAEGVWVAEAQVTGSQLQGRMTAADGSVYTANGQIAGDGGVAAAAEAVVAQLLDQARSGWRAANIVDYSRRERLDAVVRFANLSVWAEIRRRLTALAMIEKVEETLLSNVGAEITIRYYGDREGLQAALTRQNLALVPLGVDWELIDRIRNPDAAVQPVPPQNSGLAPYGGVAPTTTSTSPAAAPATNTGAPAAGTSRQGGSVPPRTVGTGG